MRKLKDNLLKSLIYLSAFITVGILVWILGYVFSNGIGLINWNFISNEYNEKTSYVEVKITNTPLSINQESLNEKAFYNQKVDKPLSDAIYSEKLGIAVMEVEHSLRGKKENQFIVAYIENGSEAGEALDKSGKKIGINLGDVITKIDGEALEGKDLKDLNAIVSGSNESLVKITKPGYGVLTNIVTTLYMIILSLSIAAPIGILAAIYLVEYAKPGKLVNVIRFATESLSGIPSIIFGLFGMAFFVVFLKFNLSLLSGALTISIILLPVIIRSTEEALKSVPDAYREASYGLGATKLQTISKIIIPSAIPGILVAVILSIGRIVGESAALLLTAGTVAKIPESLFASGSTLTVQAYYVAKEEANIQMACAIGIVVIVLIIVLNILAKLISKIFNKANY
ncbi:MAG: phosphate ABC transporter permease PstA [Eubacteriaceae bacterium]|nr:phosphate ABC transporter permease PstA [Eubacteriaceae bacterium]